jgi:hypothetical protein
MLDVITWAFDVTLERDACCIGLTQEFSSPVCYHGRSHAARSAGDPTKILREAR